MEINGINCGRTVSNIIQLTKNKRKKKREKKKRYNHKYIHTVNMGYTIRV